MSLINKKAVKQLILQIIKDKRPHLNITRVSTHALDSYATMLRAQIVKDVMRHPTKGKTFDINLL